MELFREGVERVERGAQFSEGGNIGIQTGGRFGKFLRGPRNSIKPRRTACGFVEALQGSQVFLFRGNGSDFFICKGFAELAQGFLGTLEGLDVNEALNRLISFSGLSLNKFKNLPLAQQLDFRTRGGGGDRNLLIDDLARALGVAGYQLDGQRAGRLPGRWPELLQSFAHATIFQ